MRKTTVPSLVVAAGLASSPDTAILAPVLPTISFCGAVPWWKWCRQRPKSGFFRWLFRP